MDQSSESDEDAWNLSSLKTALGGSDIPSVDAARLWSSSLLHYYPHIKAVDWDYRDSPPEVQLVRKEASRKRCREVPLMPVVKRVREELSNPFQPFLLSSTVFEARVSGFPHVTNIQQHTIYHPHSPRNSKANIMAVIAVGTCTYNHFIDIGRNFFSVKTDKFIFATSTNITCCAGNRLELSLRFVSRYNLSNDLQQLSCTPKSIEEMAKVCSVPTHLASQSEFLPLDFAQGICLPQTPLLDIQDFYISYASELGTPLFEEDSISKKPLQAIIAFQYTSDEFMTDLLIENCSSPFKKIGIIGGIFNDFGTRACNVDIMACGWKIFGNPEEVSIEVVGLNLSDWNEANEPGWDVRRDETIRSAQLNQFFEGKKNGFVFIVHTNAPCQKEAVILIRRSLTRIPTIGIQSNNGSLLFQGEEFNVNPTKLMNSNPLNPFDRRDITLALLMVAY